MTYYSKIDFWILCLLLAVPAALISAAIAFHSIPPAIICGCVVLLYGLALLPTSYRLDPDSLQVRSGIFRNSIPYSAIRSVRSTHSILAAPALSLDRLEITYGSSGLTLLSPRDPSTFLRDLSQRLPNLDLKA